VLTFPSRPSQDTEVFYGPTDLPDNPGQRVHRRTMAQEEGKGKKGGGELGEGNLHPSKNGRVMVNGWGR